MSISLAPEVEELIHKKVESGRYGSPSDVVSKALQLLEEEEQASDAGFEEIKHKIALGLKELDEGKGLPLNNETYEALIARIRAKAENHNHN